MKFGLVDRIIEFFPGERLVSVKAVSTAEEYLADHFPTFPVLPGVLMLEALVESAAWLVREWQAFTPHVILLRQARNVTFRRFVRPGNLLTVSVTCRRLALGDSEFEGLGHCHEEEAIRARFGLVHIPLSELGASREPGENRLKEVAEARFAALRR